LLSLWKDPKATFPKWEEEIWWELWVPNNSVREFTTVAKQTKLIIKPPVVFIERTVFAAYGTAERINIVRLASGAFAEIRRIKETPSYYMEMDSIEQEKWVDDLVGRIEQPKNDALSLCLLDTGVNNAHALLQNLLQDDDMHAYHPEWSTKDTGHPYYHGTAMAGLSLYGDLQEILTHSDPIQQSYRLESVRILSPNNDTDKDLYGAIIDDAVSQVEIQAPHRKRSFCLAITSPHYEGGHPSEWSASIDTISYNNGDESRLFCISTGNVRETTPQENYIDRCKSETIESPAQAWNALSIGAYTEKTNITDDGFDSWSAIAGLGMISPHSRSSYNWEKQWPIKPEVLFEGGNWAASPDGTLWDDGTDSLSLLTTHHSPLFRQFNTANATSSATALANRLITNIQAKYPKYTLETVRGLVVHGASWTEKMLEELYPLKMTPRGKLLRLYGYGAASEESSLSSFINRSTVISEQVIQPFKKVKSKVELNESHLVPLPLPKNFLEELGNQIIRLKVTLSYFIEPNPSQRGYSGRYSYASHGLRFIMQCDGESIDRLISRAGSLSKKEGESDQITGDDHWFLGANQRNKGCIISDIWEASATDIAQLEHIAIYPIGGWWKTRPKHGKGNTKSKYSLILSLETDDSSIDIYSRVENKVKALVSASISSEIEIKT